MRILYSIQYIKRILARLPHSQQHLSTRISSVRSNPTTGKVTLTTEDGISEAFDHVIMACHSDATLRILGQEATEKETSILGRIQWTKNKVVLHSDTMVSETYKCLAPELTSILIAYAENPRCVGTLEFPHFVDGKPRRQSVLQCKFMFGVSSHVFTHSISRHRIERMSCRTFNMNLLQKIDEQRYGNVFVSLNPLFPPNPSLTQAEYEFSHPLFNDSTMQAQRLAPTIQGARNISFAGAWLNFGFHEDAWTSGLLAATRYAPALTPSVKLPWGIDTVEGSVWAEKISHEQLKMGLQAQILGCIFDFVENTGLRRVVGTVLAIPLSLVLYGLRALTCWDMDIE